MRPQRSVYDLSRGFHQVIVANHLGGLQRLDEVTRIHLAAWTRRTSPNTREAIGLQLHAYRSPVVPGWVRLVGLFNMATNPGEALNVMCHVVPDDVRLCRHTSLRFPQKQR